MERMGIMCNTVPRCSKWKLTFDEMFLSATVINYAFGIFHGPDILFIWVTFLAEFLTPKPSRCRAASSFSSYLSPSPE